MKDVARRFMHHMGLREDVSLDTTDHDRLLAQELVRDVVDLKVRWIVMETVILAGAARPPSYEDVRRD